MVSSDLRGIPLYSFCILRMPPTHRRISDVGTSSVFPHQLPVPSCPLTSDSFVLHPPQPRGEDSVRVVRTANLGLQSDLNVAAGMANQLRGKLAGASGWTKRLLDERNATREEITRLRAQVNDGIRLRAPFINRRTFPRTLSCSRGSGV